MPAAGWTLRAAPGAVIDLAGIPEAIDRALFAAGTVLKGEWQDHLRQPGRGRRYEHELRTLRIGDRVFVAPVAPRVPHTASRPGDSPAPDTGAGLGSIGVERIEPGRTAVGTDLAYLRYLKDGVFDHPAGIVIEPRQVEPNIEAVKPRMTDEMVRALAPVGVRVT